MESAQTLSTAIFAACSLVTFTSVALAFYRSARRTAEAL